MFYTKLHDRSDASFVASSTRIESRKPVPTLRNFKTGLSSTSRSSSVSLSFRITGIPT